MKQNKHSTVYVVKWWYGGHNQKTFRSLGDAITFRDSEEISNQLFTYY